jgi:hypothetical protein
MHMSRTQTTPASSRQAIILSVRRTLMFGLYLIIIMTHIIRILVKISSPLNPLSPLWSRSSWILHNIYPLTASSTLGIVALQNTYISSSQMRPKVDSGAVALDTRQDQYTKNLLWDTICLFLYCRGHQKSGIWRTESSQGYLGPARARAWISIKSG